MEINSMTEILFTDADDAQPLEILTGTRTHQGNEAHVPDELPSIDNAEERRLLHSLSLACHKLQPHQFGSNHAEDETLNIELQSKETLWFTIDSTLKSLYQTWSTKASSSSLKSLLYAKNQNNSSVSDHDVEVALSGLLCVWQHSLDELKSNTQNDFMTSIMVTTIQTLSLTTHHKRWIHELINHHLEHWMQLIRETASLSFASTHEVTCTIKSNIELYDEKKSDDIHAEQSTKDIYRVMKVLFQFIRDVTIIGGTKSNCDSDYMVVLYEEIHPVIFDSRFYSNTALAIDISAILWKWSVALSRPMAHNAEIWNAVKHMWLGTTDIRSQIEEDKNEIVNRNLSAAIGILIASVVNSEVDADDASSSDQSITSEHHETITIVQDQDWLIPKLLKVIRSADDNSTIDGQRRCMRTLRYLISVPWGKSFVYKRVTHELLASDIFHVVSNNKVDCDTCALACQVTRCIIIDRSSEGKFGPYIETSLITLITDSSQIHDVDDDYDDAKDIPTRNNLVRCACEALTASLQYSPWNRSIGCFTEHFFEEILNVLHTNIDQPSYHTCCVNLFLALVARNTIIRENTDSNANTTRIKGVCNILASYSSVLETFAILLSPNATKPDFDSPRSNVLKVLIVMLEQDDSEKRIKKDMAADEHLLTALVNVCLVKSNDSPIKDETKRIVMALIPEL
jgi:hypothetical protein